MSFTGVAISGKAGAGKNEYGEALCDSLISRSMWPVTVAFGDAVKEELMSLYGMKKGDPGARDMMVEIGHGRRQEDPLHWVKQLAQTCDSLIAAGCVPIITDLRYENEYDWAVDSGMIVVRVDTSGMDRAAILSQRGEDSQFAWSEHPSETALDTHDFHFRFWNPHGDSHKALRHYAALATSLLLDEVLPVRA